MRKFRSHALKVGKGAAGIAAMIASWEAVRALGLVDRRDLPSAASIVETAAVDLWRGDLAPAVLATIGSWAPGLAVAAVAGAGAGIALALLMLIAFVPELVLFLPNLLVK